RCNRGSSLRWPLILIRRSALPARSSNSGHVAPHMREPSSHIRAAEPPRPAVWITSLKNARLLESSKAHGEPIASTHEVAAICSRNKTCQPNCRNPSVQLNLVQAAPPLNGLLAKGPLITTRGTSLAHSKLGKKPAENDIGVKMLLREPASGERVCLVIVD